MDLITYDNAHKIKDILLNGYFDNKSIKLEFKNINAKVNINGLTEVEKSEKFIDEDMDIFQAAELLSSNGMLIKRPILIGNGSVIVGFKEEIYNEIN